LHSYWGEAKLELIGVFAEDRTIVVLIWAKNWNFPEPVAEVFQAKLLKRIREKLISKIPELRRYPLEAFFFDSSKDLKKAGLQGVFK